MRCAVLLALPCRTAPTCSVRTGSCTSRSNSFGFSCRVGLAALPAVLCPMMRIRSVLPPQHAVAIKHHPALCCYCCMACTADALQQAAEAADQVQDLQATLDSGKSSSCCCWLMLL